MSSSNKVIAIIGATGNQGGSVARTFLALPNWHVRCITRKPSSQKAAVLKELGAEVIQGDLSEPTTLKTAFSGAHAIFLNTEFRETYHPLVASGLAPETCSQMAFDKEVSDGKNAADVAAGIPTLERLIISSLPSLRDVGKGKDTRSLHPEAKAAIVKYIEDEKPELAGKMSILYLGIYATHRILHPALDPESGHYIAMTPCSPQAMMAIVDAAAVTGLFVRSLIEDEEPGTKLLAYNNDSYLSLKAAIDLWSKVAGKEAQYIQQTADFMHDQLGLPYEYLDALSSFADHGYDDMKDAIRPDQLKRPPKTGSFETWLRQKHAEQPLGEVDQS
ncbi:NAD(P)-binding protein [Thozetella sp. PMI_491]|nr:NAD(P)-binding protein [Thozetella sp. PMI_491]